MKKSVNRKKILLLIFGLIFILSFMVFLFNFQNFTGKAISSNILSTNFKVMTWNLHGEVFIAGIPTVGDWKDIPRSINEILNVVSSENPDLVVFDAVYVNFENQLKQGMISKGYSYNYISNGAPTSNSNFRRAIFSKYPFVSTDYYVPNIQEYFTNDETYVAKNAIFRVKINLAGNTYSFFAGGVAPGRRQLKLNNDYIQNNIYQPLINSNEPHFILGDLNLFLESFDNTWFNTVYLAPENFPNAKFYVDNYQDVCKLYPDVSCMDSVPPVDGSGRIDQIIFRDYSGRKTIYLKKAYIRQDTDNSYDISDHFPVIADFLITNSQVLSGDINADKKAEILLINNAAYSWNINTPEGVNLKNIQFGYADSIPLVGDYDGDNKLDIGIYDSIGGKWYAYSLGTNQNIFYNKPWGGAGMIPVSGDYDGDGKDDLAVWNPVDGKWYVYSLPTSQAIVWAVAWGSKGMIPVSGDYDGDGKSDLALWNPVDGKWYVRDAANTKTIAYGVAWGSKGMIPVSGDYDGDGKSDLALWNSVDGKWYVSDAANTKSIVWAKQFGSNAMIPVSGDFSGDGKSDLAYYDLINKKLFFESTGSLQTSNCIDSDWSFSLSPDVCPSSGIQTKSWNKLRECSGGVSHPVSESITCNYQAPICTYYYSSWGECSSVGKQTRTVVSATPSGCQGNPILTQSCNYIPTCAESDWSFSLSPNVCPASGQQTKVWSKIGSCSGGIFHVSSETVSCNYSPSILTCNSFTYSAWNECSESGIQTRNLTSSLPVGCVDGNPSLYQSCNYVPICTSSNWVSQDSDCSSNNTFVREWSLLGTCKEGVQKNSKELLSCDYTLPTCTSFDYSVWGECLKSNIQTRIVLISSPSGCIGGNPELVKTCVYSIPEFINDSSESENFETENIIYLGENTPVDTFVENNVSKFMESNYTRPNNILKDYVEEPGLFTKIWCKILHPFSSEKYESCIYEK